MPFDISNLAERMLGTYGMLYNRLKNFPGADGFVDVLINLSSLERFYTEGLKSYGMNPKRVTMLAKILETSVTSLNEVTAEMFSIVIDDCEYLRQFINGLEDGFKTVGDYEFSIDDSSIRQIFSNLSIGTARSSTSVFKQYAHNNHLLRRLLQEPSLFIGDALDDLTSCIPGVRGLHIVMEQSSEVTLKISDAAIWVKIECFQLTKHDGSVLKVFDSGEYVAFPVTFDSKVFQDGIAGIKAKFEQQFELFFSDRVKQLVLPMLDELDALSGSISEAEKTEFLQSVIPGIFRHYVFVPSDFPQSIDSLATYYKEQMRLNVPEFLEREMGKNHPDIALVEEILLKHTDDHFGSGRFINRNSEITYEWATTY